MPSEGAADAEVAALGVEVVEVSEAVNIGCGAVSLNKVYAQFRIDHPNQLGNCLGNHAVCLGKKSSRK